MEFKSVRFSYNKRKMLLKSITGEIPKGKITTIIGPNGCGKSTLLSLLSGSHTVDAGDISLNGKSIQAYSLKELSQELSIVYQQNEAPSDLTVEKLISFGRIPYQKWLSKQTDEDSQAVNWAISLTNLESKRNCTLHELSGGERQRVWIAMSLAQKTERLFLDEPTTYLDLYYQIELLELVKKLNTEQHLTIIMVLHDINQALKYSDFIIVMKEGEIVAAGDPKETMTEEMIKKIYGVNVRVQYDQQAGFFIVPVSI